MTVSMPSRGDIWWADLDPVRGHEQGGDRPVLIVSTDLFNHGPAMMIITVPLTRTQRTIRSEVPVNPPDGGLTARSFILPEQVRSISKQRLRRQLGTVNDQTMAEVEDRLRMLLDL